MAGSTRSDGIASRRIILARALALSANLGPDGVTVGLLANALGMSKSGVFAHFGSKEALDLAVVTAAAEAFAQAVTTPAQAAPEGVARLAALVEGWLGEVGADSATLVVLSRGRAGIAAPIRERLRAWHEQWRGVLAAEVLAARRTGELGAGVDARQVAFEIDALLAATSRDGEAGADDTESFARRAIEIRLQQLATER